jgi:hypothetical protein
VKLDLDALEKAAKAAGGDKWEESDADGYVFGSDGDSVCVCHANMGAWPEPIFPEHRAAFIAAANPAAVLELIERLRRAEQSLEQWKTAAIEREQACQQVERVLAPFFAGQSGLTNSEGGEHD